MLSFHQFLNEKWKTPKASRSIQINGWRERTPEWAKEILDRIKTSKKWQNVEKDPKDRELDLKNGFSMRPPNYTDHIPNFELNNAVKTIHYLGTKDVKVRDVKSDQPGINPDIVKDKLQNNDNFRYIRITQHGESLTGCKPITHVYDGNHTLFAAKLLRKQYIKPTYTENSYNSPDVKPSFKWANIKNIFKKERDE